jgi:hypothetical protein
MATNFSAYSRHALRKATGDICFFFGPRLRSTCSSMGRPWQSQPGTKGASCPAMLRLRTTRSFRILLRAVPRWIWPFA